MNGSREWSAHARGWPLLKSEASKRFQSRNPWQKAHYYHKWYTASTAATGTATINDINGLLHAAELQPTQPRDGTRVQDLLLSKGPRRSFFSSRRLRGWGWMMSSAWAGWRRLAAAAPVYDTPVLMCIIPNVRNITKRRQHCITVTCCIISDGLRQGPEAFSPALLPYYYIQWSSVAVS